jgi:hypothetical protein
MNRTSRKTIGALAAMLAVAALAPGASSAQAPAGPFERTPTERGQAVGEPGEPGSAALNALYSRTRTELGQSVTPSVTPGPKPTGFAWGDAAIGAGSVLGLALIGFGVVALVTRRRGIHSSRVPATSSRIAGG